LDAFGKYNVYTDMQYLLELPKIDWHFLETKHGQKVYFL